MAHYLFIIIVLMAIFVSFLSTTPSVYDPPEIVERPRNVAVYSGGVATFYCRARGNPTLQISWRKNGKNVPPRSYTYLVISRPSMSILRIDSVIAGKDDAKYECVVENGVGETVIASATLSIYPEKNLPPGFPRITSWPDWLPVIETGRTHLLECGVSGIPEPSISWLHDRIPVDLSNPRYQQIASESKSKVSLQIINTEEKDQGKYECVAENLVGIAVSKPLNLYIKIRRVPPFFLNPFQSIFQVTSGSSLNITCVAGGSPVPFLNWRKDLEDMTERPLPIGHNILVLEDIQESANYTCVASNRLGTKKQTTLVQVEKSSTPFNVRILDIRATSLHISWRYDGPTNEAVQFVIRYKVKMASDYSEISGLKINYHTVQNLNPLTEYDFHILSVNNDGPSLPSRAIFVTMGNTEPGTPPKNVQTKILSSTYLLIRWEEPDKFSGQIIGYKVFYTTNPELPVTSWDSQLINNNLLTTISPLIPDTIYTIRIQAKTNFGNGPLSIPVRVKTQHNVTSQLTELRAVNTSVTSISLEWGRSDKTEDNINNYKLYWENAFTKENFNRSLPINETYVLLDGLQPSTLYHIWLEIKLNRGVGTTSLPISVLTESSGVPNSPNLGFNIVQEEPTVSVLLVWSRPNETKGELKGYRLRYGLKNNISKVVFDLPDIQQRLIEGLGRGLDYEFRLAGCNHIGYGQENVQILSTPEGVPSAPPTNITCRLQTPEVVVIQWYLPALEYRNGHVTGYVIQLYNKLNNTLVTEQNVPSSITKTNFTLLEEKIDYEFRINARTQKGSGPFSDVVLIWTECDIVPVPIRVRATGTSFSSIQLWWETMSGSDKIIGYTVFYTMTAEDDLDQWKQKSVPITNSCELSNLERNSQYIVMLVARTASGYDHLSDKIKVIVQPEEVPTELRVHSVTTHTMSVSWQQPISLVPVSYNVTLYAVKEFVDSHGIVQKQSIDPVTSTLSKNTLSFSVQNLIPFTTYNVNITAVPKDQSYRPPAKITFTTKMASPPPMVKPDFERWVNDKETIVILPQASEEYGPINHYLLVVVPESEENKRKEPYQLKDNELMANNTKVKGELQPYVAAKFVGQNVPYSFLLGNDQEFEGMLNKKMNKTLRYRIFLRAVVDDPGNYLETSSSFSDYLA